MLCNFRWMFDDVKQTDGLVEYDEDIIIILTNNINPNTEPIWLAGTNYVNWDQVYKQITVFVDNIMRDLQKVHVREAFIHLSFTLNDIIDMYINKTTKILYYLKEVPAHNVTCSIYKIPIM